MDLLYIVNGIIIAIVSICWILIIKKHLVSRFGKVKTVKAKVCDKYVSHSPSGKPQLHTPHRYTVVLSASDKKISLDVSEYSNNGYRIGEKGTLKYRGNRLISFK